MKVCCGMRHPDPFKALDDSFRGKRSIPNPIASDTLTFRDAKGRKRQARIEIGQPQPVPGDKDQNWFCPLYIQDWTCFPAIGIGPLDSLMNAVTILRGFHDHVGGMHITYATSKPKRRRR